MSFKSIISVTGNFIKMHSSEICLGIGVCGLAGTVVTTAKVATPIINMSRDYQAEKEELNFEFENDKTNEEYKNKFRAIRLDYYKNVAVCVLPVAGSIAVTLGGFFGAYNIISTKLTAMTAAAESLEAMFNKYRARVVDDAGEEKDQYYMTGAKKVKKTKVSEVNEETGEVEEYTVYSTKEDLDMVSEFAVCFDEVNSSKWTKHGALNKAEIRSAERFANIRLKAKGWLSLNEVYEMLGVPATDAGQVFGWIDNPEAHKGARDDLQVELQIWDTVHNTKKADGMNVPAGEDSWWIVPNVQGIMKIDSVPDNYWGSSAAD